MPNNYFIPGTYSGSVAWTNTALWSAGLPITGQDLWLTTGSTLTIDTGLSQGTVLLASINLTQSAPKVGGLGTNYLQIGATIQNIGLNNVDGTTTGGNARCKIDSGTWLTTINHINSANASGDGNNVPASCFLGSNAGNVFNMIGGNAGIAAQFPTEVAGFPTINRSGGTLIVGSGNVGSVVNNEGASGNLVLSSGGNSIVINNIDGTLETRGTFVLGGTLSCYGGTLKLNHRPASGTMCGAVVMAGGTLDLSGNPAAFSFTSLSYQEGNIKIARDGQQTLGTISLPFGNKTKKTLSNNS